MYILDRGRQRVYVTINYCDEKKDLCVTCEKQEKDIQDLQIYETKTKQKQA